MKAQVLLCECCGAALDAPRDATRVRCEFCGSATVLHGSTAVHASVAAPRAERPAGASFRPVAREPAEPLTDYDYGPTLEISGTWGLAAVLTVAVCAATISGAFALAAILCLLGLFLVGTLVVVGAHLSAAAQEDGVGESEPVRARTKAEVAHRGKAPQDAVP